MNNNFYNNGYGQYSYQQPNNLYAQNNYQQQMQRVNQTVFVLVNNDAELNSLTCSISPITASLFFI